jgi:MoaA/NifB/PqqE/SkfB family radical SAM enzyme
MPTSLSSLKQFFAPARAILPAIYHYISPADDPRNYRLHLRIEPDGSGILVINASTILHLNQTAAEYAYYMVKNYPVNEVGKEISKRYQVTAEQAMRDYQNLAESIQVLINTPDLDPQSFLDFERQRPFSGIISAPYRLDCALTYQYSGEQQPAPNERAKVELSTPEWKSILDKAHAAGIPQVVFTGGEPTLRPDLVELLAYAEKHDLVTGLITDGNRLVDKEYLQSLLQTGLDHIMIILHRLDSITQSALENALVEDIFVAVHLTIASEDITDLTHTIDELASKGVRAISLSTSEPGLRTALDATRNYLAARQLELIWNLPVPYSQFNPIDLEMNMIEERLGAGSAWLYIEPDGDVLPDQDIQQVLGNMLADSWETIWKNSRNAARH